MFQIKIIRPVFLIGPPRTGTTFLNWMLSRDPHFQCTPLWRMSYPCPPGSVTDYRNDSRYKKVKFGIGNSYTLFQKKCNFSPWIFSGAHGQGHVTWGHELLP